MPNTLVHIGINGFLTKSISKKYNLFWIYMGSIIPDIPWISKKFLEFFIPQINGYDLQAYLIIQSTLFFSLILSFAISLFSKNLFRTLLILSLGSVLHLLADSIETKWANGVHLFAPLNWNLLNFGIIWPGNFIIHLLGFLGIAFFVWNWRESKNFYPDFLINKSRFLYFIIILLFYIFLPLLFTNKVFHSDNHFIQTLKNQNSRIGKYVELDRKTIFFDENSGNYYFKSFNKDIIELTNIGKLNSDKVSVKGKFIKNNLIEVIEYKESLGILRDGASYIGLFLILLFNAKILLRKKFATINSNL